VGLNPDKSTLFIQSRVLEHAELHLLLSMITPLSWLERVPTYKEQIENLKDRDLGTYGFLGYPLLQTADIVMYGTEGQDLLVPVGEDQVPHIELSREVVRRFNGNFGLKISTDLWTTENKKAREVCLAAVGVPPVDPPDAAYRLAAEKSLRSYIADSGFENFVEKTDGVARPFFKHDPVLQQPGHLLTETPRLPGLDGRRMAKSYSNAIWLTDPPDEIRTKVRSMMTDPQRQRRTDPGRPEICPVFAWHKLFSPPDQVAQIDRDCRSAGIGCVQCKGQMADNLVRWIEPIQAQRQEFESRPQKVWDILDAGSKTAQRTAQTTMERVRNAVFRWDEAQKLTRS
jgi:tryptophanyl-tRNA synthetase